MSQSVSIPNNAPEQKSMNFEWLRQKGIEYLQRYAGQVWTDYNVHDPGVTILEQLCYAITDLGFRINSDIKQLIARPEGEAYKEFFSPKQILTNLPVSLVDYRKLMIDVDGVRNAWIFKDNKPLPETYYTEAKHETVVRYKDAAGQWVEEKESLSNSHGLFALANSEALHIKGLYRVVLDVEGNPTEVRKRVEDRLHAHRNLCEDFSEISVLEPELITLKLNIEINESDNLAGLVKQVFHKIEHHIAPSFRFYSWQEMKAKGYTIDEIFDGPALAHGFLCTADLQRNTKRSVLRASDLINEIMNVEGVETVSTISMQADKGNWEFWSLPLSDTKVARLDLKNSEIKLTRNGISFWVDTETLDIQNRPSAMPNRLAAETDVVLTEKSYEPLLNYHSIQHDFPNNFGLGKQDLLESDSPERKAQAKQLKAYLVFFEQILANYFAQLEHFKDFYALSNTEKKSYYNQVLHDVPEIDQVLGDIDSFGPKLDCLSEDENSIIDRRNRALNHLLARFSEDFTDYALLLYNQNSTSKSIGEKMIRLKTKFLQDYPAISAGRGKAFNYRSDAGGCSGLEKRLSRLLDMDELSEDKFFVVEHILLRPVTGDYFQKYGENKDSDFFATQKEQNDFDALSQWMSDTVCKDPYSLQLTFVFPDWIEQAQNLRFRDFVEQVVRQECPAHLVVYIQWLKPQVFAAFKTTYARWASRLSHMATR